MANDAIAAIATPPGRGGIGIVRVSGPHLYSTLQALTRQAISARRATVATFYDAQGAQIDHGLALYFPAPNSYTGEDVIELQGHGGTVVLQLLLRRCVELGARIAEPGEFTKRAYLNEKLDLAQAESVADLIDASTTRAARCAMRSLCGEFSGRIGELVGELIELRMHIEVALDFPEEDVDTMDRSSIDARFERLTTRLRQIASASKRGSLMREGVRVVVAGHPNVGKSSLLNRLAREQVAIVTEIAGTTRDPVRHALELQGIPLYIVDTAGVRESIHPVEKIGIAMTWREVEQADLVLWVSDATRPETQVIDPDLQKRNERPVRHLHVVNKIDLLSDTLKTAEAHVRVSALTGVGIDDLEGAMLSVAGWDGDGDGEGTYLARTRHLEALQVANEHIAEASRVGLPMEVLAEELRLAQHALETISGVFTADDLLGEIFSKFCLGK